MASEADPSDVERIVDQIRPILANCPPELPGAVIADLLSIFIAGHHPALRDEVMGELRRRACSSNQTRR